MDWQQKLKVKWIFKIQLKGPAILRGEKELRAGEWVQVTADRSFRDGLLMVDNDGTEIRAKSPGSTRGLNLNTRLFIGGWDRQKVRLNPGVNMSSSFDGCVSQFEVHGMEVDLVNSVIDSANVEDCGGASPCERKPCLNGGVCTETGAGLGDFTCDCEEGFRWGRPMKFPSKKTSNQSEFRQRPRKFWIFRASGILTFALRLRR